MKNDPNNPVEMHNDEALTHSTEMATDSDSGLNSTSPAPHKPQKKRRFVLWFFLVNMVVFGFVIPLAAAGWYYFSIYPTLPDPTELKEVSYKVPLRIVTQDNKLISEIGTNKRIPLEYSQIPERMTQAIISSEDESFFEHGGVDYKGIARAVFELVTTGEKQSGGSTITMQVARNFFLSNERTYLRKFNEIILSYKIENGLSKEEILALYLNKIFLGYRSYGVAAAAQTYYGRPINELELNEYAMIAGLPKAPSAYNPIINPTRAKIRRDYVLKRMHLLNFINDQQLQDALAVEVHAKRHTANIETDAGYVAEMARSFALENFGSEALENGLTIVTTLTSDLQDKARQAVHQGLQNYERRHGYRGPIKHLELNDSIDRKSMVKQLTKISNFGDLQVAVVTALKDNQATVFTQENQVATLAFADMKWAAKFISVNRKGKKPTKTQDVLKVGDVIYIQPKTEAAEAWQLAQNPRAESSLVSIDSKSGRVLALVGGYDYFRSKFNRAIQGGRQIGSNVKPFLYSTALHNGMTAASIINDAPVVFHDRNLEGKWRPENYSGRFYGPTRLRIGLAYSRNLVSIRLLQKLGINTFVDYLQRFGFPAEELQQHKNLSLSLGNLEFTPWQMARAYATFANDGYLVEPFVIDEVRDFAGKTLYKAKNKRVCQDYRCIPDDPLNAPQVIEKDNAFIMKSLLQDVIQIGSGRKAKALKREDIAGKTGTTNDQVDAWFSGFNPNITTSVWVGFDQPSTLGRYEVGGRAALPIWMDYMQLALQPYPNEPLTQPENIVTIDIDPKTGQAVPPGTAGAVKEVFREDLAPEVPDIGSGELKEITNELFE